MQSSKDLQKRIGLFSPLLAVSFVMVAVVVALLLCGLLCGVRWFRLDEEEKNLILMTSYF
jgi:hypothetical protein